MIPHLSIALLTSVRFQIEDPGVQELANESIAAQVRDIKMMECRKDDIRTNGAASLKKRAKWQNFPVNWSKTSL